MRGWVGVRTGPFFSEGFVMSEEKRSISRDEHLSLVGLLLLGDKHQRALDEIEHALYDITREQELSGHTTDALYNIGGPAQERAAGLLKRLGLTVEKRS